ncbi:TonB-dependent receptor plug domain-containing protein [Sphingomonas oligophenolica]|uniref:TonB-dependent receptor n=1 Tax=Sphingomonas oligophenolica TaxID=301154 RepID=A0A502CP69_9SPHN|nr:TonB-dependent receptor [Sphingomonas oligophenolica]TPG14444.1 TonB-dependent receptor [Sphingomonas oligophenolica]
MRRSLLGLLVIGCSPFALTAAALAQVVTTPPQETASADSQASDAADPQKDILITGSRIAGRTIADSPVPIDVIGGDQLTNGGYTETNKLLTQLVPSFNFPQPSLTDGTDSLRPATLRGLAPDQTLVLVNGKRRHQSALLNLNGSVGRGSGAVDLNEIPPIAIDRIEVLRDGASSLYGSDAIAGVINIQLSKRPGVRGSVTFGQYRTKMDGVNNVTGVAVGANGQPVVAAAGGGNNDLLQLNYGDERVRHDGDTLTLAASIGLPMAEGSYFVFTSQFRDRQPTNRSGADPRRQYPTIGDPRELTFNRFSHGYGDGLTDDYNLFLNAGTTLGKYELYTFGSYGIRDGIGAGFYRRANDARNRDFAASTTTFVPYYADGFLPKIQSEIEDVSIAGGVRGDFIDGWNGDLSVVYGSNKLLYDTIDSFNVSLGGVDSPKRFNAGGLAAGQTVANLDISHKFDVGFFKSLGIAFGGEYRNENFRIFRGEVASYVAGQYAARGAAPGAQVFPGFKPANEVDVSRDSFAGYGELDADVSDRLSVQLAGRYEHFSDFGSTVNGKAAGRFELVRGIAIRGSVSTGFRAPSLAQQYFSTTSTNSTFVNGVATLLDVLTVPVSSPVAVALGSKPLKPEKALNFGGGITFDPIPGLSLTADYYNIRIRDRVLLTENLTGTAVVNLLNANGIVGVSSARFFVNGADTKTEGVDIVGTYRLPDMGIGTIRLTAGYNYNTQSITKRAVLPSLPNIILYGRAESIRLTNGQPKDKLNLGIDYDNGPVGFTARTNRFGKVVSAGGSSDLTIPAGQASTDFTLQPKWVTDVEVRVKPIQGIEFAVGADNVFDVYPTKSPAGGAFGNNAYFLPYSSLSPFGFNGRFLYGRVAFDF